MSLADFLTVLRLILVPFFLFYFLKGDYDYAFILFVVAGCTDLIDGTIARLLKRQTKFGAFLDPIADKALMMTTVTCLLVLEIVPFWFFFLVVFRDTMILVGLAYLKVKKTEVDLKPVWTSKLGTLSNITTVVFGFLSYLRPGGLFLGISMGVWFHLFLGLSAILVVVSGWQYFCVGLQILKKVGAHAR